MRGDAGRGPCVCGADVLIILLMLHFYRAQGFERHSLCLAYTRGPANIHVGIGRLDAQCPQTASIYHVPQLNGFIHAATDKNLLIWMKANDRIAFVWPTNAYLYDSFCVSHTRIV